MELLENFEEELLGKIESIIKDSLDEMSSREELQASISKMASDNVYSYQASPQAMESRRYQIAKNLEIEKQTSSIRETGVARLIIRNVTEMQNGEPNEVDVVEKGLKEYRQPYPRPFMEEGLSAYVSSGRAEEILERNIAKYGL